MKEHTLNIIPSLSPADHELEFARQVRGVGIPTTKMLSPYSGLSTVVLATLAAAIVVSVLVLLGALTVYRKRRRSFIYDGSSGRDSEKGNILLAPERGSTRNLISRDVDFTVPLTFGSQSSLTYSRRVLSTPDLSQYEATGSDLNSPSTASPGSTRKIPILTKQYSVDLTASLQRCGLGALDPELYKATDSDDDIDLPDGHIGRVWFTLEYQKDLERLVVNVIKIKNLPSRTSGYVNGCDPVIRLCLLPDERRYLQSRQKRKTCNPRFDETFCFQISGKCIDERVLKVTVFDVDVNKKFKVIGHAVYPLKDLDLTVEDKLFLTRDLSRTVIEAPSYGQGEIFTSLCYNDNIGRLAVTIIQAKGLKQVADSYVKVSFLQHNKTFKCKKTSVVKNDCNPVYNESFTFKASSLETASIVVHLMQQTPGHGKDIIVGRVAFGSYMFARGRALEHWNDMLSNCREQLRRWHYLQP